MITRNTIYRWFKIEHDAPDFIFKSMSDDDLAKDYNLKVLRKGYFIN